MLILSVLCAQVLFYLAFPRDVHAYLDPGTGSYVFQVIAAFAIGFAFALKHYFHKLKALVSKVFYKTDHSKNGH